MKNIDLETFEEQFRNAENRMKRPKINFNSIVVIILFDIILSLYKNGSVYVTLL